MDPELVKNFLELDRVALQALHSRSPGAVRHALDRLSVGFQVMDCITPLDARANADLLEARRELERLRGSEQPPADAEVVLTRLHDRFARYLVS
ncbi:MAG TPA: hypothetical protein VGO93_22730 [Candidatus Xenobia bacterium]|jgi:hypothetical protein